MTGKQVTFVGPRIVSSAATLASMLVQLEVGLCRWKKVASICLKKKHLSVFWVRVRIFCCWKNKKGSELPEIPFTGFNYN
jgi:hypothetical protein